MMYDAETLARFLFSATILVGYLTNIATGYSATRAVLDRSEQGRHGVRSLLRGAWEGCLFSFTASTKRKTSFEIAYLAPWVSTLAALWQFAAHFLWFSEGAWVYQEGLFLFCIAHYIVITAVNFYHLDSVVRSKTL